MPHSLRCSLCLLYVISLAISLHFLFHNLSFLLFHVTPSAGAEAARLVASLSGVLATAWVQLFGCDKGTKEEKFSH